MTTLSELVIEKLIDDQGLLKCKVEDLAEELSALRTLYASVLRRLYQLEAKNDKS